MTRLVRLDTSLILPSEYVVRGDRLRFVYNAHMYGRESNLPPITLRYFDGERITINGLHRALVCDLLEKPVLSWIAHSDLDRLQQKEWPRRVAGFAHTNEQVSSRYARAIEAMLQLKRNGITSYSSLREHFGLRTASDIAAYADLTNNY